MCILDELYHEWYIMKSGNHPDMGEAQKRFGELWKKAAQELGDEFSEELRGSIFDYMNDECCQDFQAGFRLGAQLMLELQLTAAP